MNALAHHWNWFIALETDLAQLSRYIELHKDNFKTYSIETLKIVVNACSEIDVICNNLPAPPGRRTIVDHLDLLKQRFPNLGAQSASLHLHDIEVKPWSVLQIGEGEKPPKPIWWEANNAAKHRRSSDYSKANLEQAINALAALQLLIIALHSDLGNQVASPPPRIILPPHHVAYETTWVGGGPSALFINNKRETSS